MAVEILVDGYGVGGEGESGFLLDRLLLDLGRGRGRADGGGAGGPDGGSGSGIATRLLDLGGCFGLARGFLLGKRGLGLDDCGAGDAAATLHLREVVGHGHVDLGELAHLKYYSPPLIMLAKLLETPEIKQCSYPLGYQDQVVYSCFTCYAAQAHFLTEEQKAALTQRHRAPYEPVGHPIHTHPDRPVHGLCDALPRRPRHLPHSQTEPHALRLRQLEVPLDSLSARARKIIREPRQPLLP